MAENKKLACVKRMIQGNRSIAFLGQDRTNRVGTLERANEHARVGGMDAKRPSQQGLEVLHLLGIVHEEDTWFRCRNWATKLEGGMGNKSSSVIP